MCEVQRGSQSERGGHDKINIHSECPLKNPVTVKRSAQIFFESVLEQSSHANLHAESVRDGSIKPIKLRCLN